MADSLQPPRARQVNWTSGAIGGVVAYLVTLLQEGSIKQILTILTPAISIFLGIAITSLIAYIYNTYMDRKYIKHLNETKSELGTALANPQTSASHKKTLRLQLERVEEVEFKRRIQVIENRRVVTVEDVLSSFHWEPMQGGDASKKDQ